LDASDKAMYIAKADETKIYHFISGAWMYGEITYIK
jgi:hypothetical protein